MVWACDAKEEHYVVNYPDIVRRDWKYEGRKAQEKVVGRREG